MKQDWEVGPVVKEKLDMGDRVLEIRKHKQESLEGKTGNCRWLKKGEDSQMFRAFLLVAC